MSSFNFLTTQNNGTYKFTGIPHSSTAPQNTNTTQLATTEFVTRAISTIPSIDTSTIYTKAEVDTSLGQKANLDLVYIKDPNVTSEEIGYLNGVTSAIQTQIDSKQANLTGAATTIASSDLTATRALVSDASGKVVVSNVTSEEIGHLDGVISSIQAQLDNKINTGSNITFNSGLGSIVGLRFTVDSNSALMIHTLGIYGSLSDMNSDTNNYAYSTTIQFISQLLGTITDKNSNARYWDWYLLGSGINDFMHVLGNTTPDRTMTVLFPNNPLTADKIYLKFPEFMYTDNKSAKFIVEYTSDGTTFKPLNAYLYNLGSGAVDETITTDNTGLFTADPPPNVYGFTDGRNPAQQSFTPNAGQPPHSAVIHQYWCLSAAPGTIKFSDGTSMSGAFDTLSITGNVACNGITSSSAHILSSGQIPVYSKGAISMTKLRFTSVTAYKLYMHSLGVYATTADMDANSNNLAASNGVTFTGSSTATTSYTTNNEHWVDTGQVGSSIWFEMGYGQTFTINFGSEVSVGYIRFPDRMYNGSGLIRFTVEYTTDGTTWAGVTVHVVGDTQKTTVNPGFWDVYSSNPQDVDYQYWELDAPPAVSYVGASNISLLNGEIKCDKITLSDGTILGSTPGAAPSGGGSGSGGSGSGGSGGSSWVDVDCDVNTMDGGSASALSYDKKFGAKYGDRRQTMWFNAHGFVNRGNQNMNNYVGHEGGLFNGNINKGSSSNNDPESDYNGVNGFNNYGWVSMWSKQPRVRYNFTRLALYTASSWITYPGMQHVRIAVYASDDAIEWTELLDKQVSSGTHFPGYSSGLDARSAWSIWWAFDTHPENSQTNPETNKYYRMWKVQWKNWDVDAGAPKFENAGKWRLPGGAGSLYEIEFH